MFDYICMYGSHIKSNIEQMSIVYLWEPGSPLDPECFIDSESCIS